MNSAPDNYSKKISKTDDSAAKLLMELLGEDPGRNFDVESIFAFKHEDGRWGWLIFEFLKRELSNISIEKSHPNRYWKQNSRKFLSLWALKKSLESAGFISGLYLVNYDDERKNVKLIKVRDIDIESKSIWKFEGVETKHINHVITEDKVMTFCEFKERFRRFNSNKKGDTWEIIEHIKNREKISNSDSNR